MLLKNKRIFLVEDDLANRAIMQIMLERQGARTSVERWGTHTIAQLRAYEPFHLILMDLMLPNGISGFDVFDRIKEQPDLAAIPVVAISAMDSSLAIPTAKRKGFNGFIPKPINYDTFTRYVADVLEGKSVWVSDRDSFKEAF